MVLLHSFLGSLYGFSICSDHLLRVDDVMRRFCLLLRHLGHSFHQILSLVRLLRKPGLHLVLLSLACREQLLLPDRETLHFIKSLQKLVDLILLCESNGILRGCRVGKHVAFAHLSRVSQETICCKLELLDTLQHLNRLLVSHSVCPGRKHLLGTN